MRRIWIYSLRISKTRLVLLGLGLLLLCLGYQPASEFVWKQNIQAISWAIADKVIVIDPGHGGTDPGAVGRSGTLEKEIVLEVAKRLEAQLSLGGAVVLMTRETDTDLCKGNYNKREDLSKRVNIANKAKADIYVGIHANKFSQSRYRGAQTFGMTGSSESKLLAETIQAELIRVLGNTNRAAKHEDFFTNRLTKMPSVIVEIGFLSNQEEEKLLIQPKYQSKMAYAIYAGIVKYFVNYEEKNK